MWVAHDPPFVVAMGHSDLIFKLEKPRSISTSSLHILWMDEILHHFETTGNHGMLVFAGESNHSRVSWVVQDFVHPQYYGILISEEWATPVST